MRVTAVSGDLLVKLALGVVVVGGAVWAYQRARSSVAATATQWWNTATNIAGSLNPANPENYAYSGVNAIGGALSSDPAGPGRNADGSWSLGNWLYDITHEDPVAAATGSSGGRQIDRITDRQLSDLGNTGDHYYDPMGNQVW